MAYTTVFGRLVRTGNPSKYTRKSVYSIVRPAAPEAPNPFMARKGEYLGPCNRSACLRPPADWYNRGSMAFYCEDCAHMLNRTNAGDEFCRDEALCYYVASAEQAAAIK